LISGDTHWGEISKLSEGLNYPLWEVTSSGLTEEWKDVSPNIHRVSEPTAEVNYGEILIDWDASIPTVSIGLKDINGSIFTQTKIALQELRSKASEKFP